MMIAITTPPPITLSPQMSKYKDFNHSVAETIPGVSGGEGEGFDGMGVWMSFAFAPSLVGGIGDGEDADGCTWVALFSCIVGVLEDKVELIRVGVFLA